MKTSILKQIQAELDSHCPDRGPLDAVEYAALEACRNFLRGVDLRQNALKSANNNKLYRLADEITEQLLSASSIVATAFLTARRRAQPKQRNNEIQAKPKDRRQQSV